MKRVNLFVQSEYAPNRDCGVYGFSLVFGSHRKSEVVDKYETKSNGLLLKAVIHGLQMIKEPCEVTVCSDSDYIVRMFQFFDYYVKHGWKTKNGSDVKDITLFKVIENIAKEKKLKITGLKKTDKETDEKVHDRFEYQEYHFRCGIVRSWKH